MIISNFANASITWPSISAELSESEGWNGFSLLVDDVQRLAGESLSYSLTGLEAGITHFFRLAVSIVLFPCALKLMTFRSINVTE